MTNPNDPRRVAIVFNSGGGAHGRIAADLAEMGWHVQTVSRSTHGLARSPANLLVVELESLGRDPLQMLQTLQHLDSAAPLLMVARREQLSSYAEELTRLSVQWPAPNDVVVPACPPEELRYRVSRLSAASSLDATGDAIHAVGTLQIHAGRRSASVGDKELALSPTEFELLLALVQADGNMVSKAVLRETVFSHGEQYGNAALSVHFTRLRDKLEKVGVDRKVIYSVNRRGYRLEPAYLEEL